MPITAEFVADFSDFVKGAASANKALNSVEQTSQDVSAAFKDMDVQRLLTDPMGSAATQMESLSATLPPMAQGVIAVVTGLIAAGTAAYTLADATATTGANLSDMSAATGIEVEALSRMSNAATVAGVELKTVERAVFDMNKRMAESPDDFAAALRSINIEVADFKAMSVDERFWAVAKALDATTDPLTRTQAGTVLLGKSYRELAGDLGDLVTAQETVAGMPIWTEQQAADAEKFKAAVAALKLEMSGMATSLGKELIPALTKTLELFKQSSQYQYFEGQIRLVGAAFNETDTALRTINGTLVATLPTVHNSAAVQTEFANATKGLALALPPVADLLKIDAEMKKEDAKASEAAAAAQKKLADAIKAMELAAFKQQGDALATVLDRLFGESALKKATVWTDAMNTFGVSVQKLRKDELEELITTMYAGIDAFVRQGDVLNPLAAQFGDLAIEAAAALNAMTPLVTVTEDLAAAQWDYVTAQDAALAASIKTRDAAKQAADEAKSGGGLLPNAIVGTGGVARDMFGRPVVAGGSISNLPVMNININSPLGTPDAIAKAVGDAVTGSYRSGGQRMPV